MTLICKSFPKNDIFHEKKVAQNSPLSRNPQITKHLEHFPFNFQGLNEHDLASSVEHVEHKQQLSITLGRATVTELFYIGDDGKKARKKEHNIFSTFDSHYSS